MNGKGGAQMSNQKDIELLRYLAVKREYATASENV